MARRELCLRKNVVQPWDQDEPATNADEPAQKACSGAKAKEEEIAILRSELEGMQAKTREVFEENVNLKREVLYLLPIV